MKSLSDCFKLSNGVEIPCIGFGTWQIPDGKETADAVCAAVDAGYRHIDTAFAYDNEKGVGQAIRDCGVGREKLFITTKLWNSDRGYDSTLKAFETSMNNLGLDYLDLYLIHWPANSQQFKNWQEINTETWRAFEKLYQEKRIRAIGVSNFLPNHLDALLAKAEIVPMVDQIEHHPGYVQAETIEYCRERNILVEAWSPLGRGKVLTAPEMMEIARQHGKTAAQICIRWSLQAGILPLPKSVTPQRIRENAEVFDFELSESDLQTIDGLLRLGGSGLHPDKVDF